MKKKFILAILSVSLLFSLTGCVGKTEYKDSSYQEVQQNNRFTFTGEYYYIGESKFDIVVDTKTKNLYLYNTSTTYSRYEVPNLTPLYDENGTIAKGK